MFGHAGTFMHAFQNENRPKMRSYYEQSAHMAITRHEKYPCPNVSAPDGGHIKVKMAEWNIEARSFLLLLSPGDYRESSISPAYGRDAATHNERGPTFFTEQPRPASSGREPGSRITGVSHFHTISRLAPRTVTC